MKNVLTTYFQKIEEKLKQVIQTEADSMNRAATKISECIQNGGIIQLFGCGHSHMLSEEVFYRAGGLAAIKPILIEPLMLHQGAVKSSQLERQNDYALTFMEQQDIKPNDVVIVISTSGVNPVPIDVALLAKEKGAFVIGICSFDYEDQPSRHKSEKRLAHVVDLAINNFAVKGDAILTYQHVDVPFTPTSTITGAAILNGIMAEAIKKMVDNGVKPPIFLSGNIEGADEHNHALIEKYCERIKLLKKEV